VDERILVRIVEMRRQCRQTGVDSCRRDVPVCTLIELLPVVQVISGADPAGHRTCWYTLGGIVYPAHTADGALDSGKVVLASATDFVTLVSHAQQETMSLISRHGAFAHSQQHCDVDLFRELSSSRDGTHWLSLAMPFGDEVAITLAAVSRVDPAFPVVPSAIETNPQPQIIASRIRSLKSLVPWQLRVSLGLVIDNALGVDVFVSRFRPSRAADVAPSNESVSLPSSRSLELPLRVVIRRPETSDGTPTLSFVIAIGIVRDLATGAAAPSACTLTLPIPAPGQVVHTRACLPALACQTTGVLQAVITISQPMPGGPISVLLEPAITVVNRSRFAVRVASALPNVTAPLRLSCVPRSHSINESIDWDLHDKVVEPNSSTPLIQGHKSDFSVLCLQDLSFNATLHGGLRAWSAVRLTVGQPDATCGSAVSSGRDAANTLETVALWAGPAISVECKAIRVPLASACDLNSLPDPSAFPLQTCLVVAMHQSHDEHKMIVTLDDDLASPVILSNALKRSIALTSVGAVALPLPLRRAMSLSFLTHLMPDSEGREPRTISEAIARAETKLRGRIAAALPGPCEAAAIDADMQLIALAKACVAGAMFKFEELSSITASADIARWPTGMAHPLQFCTQSDTRHENIPVVLSPTTAEAPFDWLLLCDAGAGHVSVARGSTRVFSNNARLFWWPPTVALPGRWAGDISAPISTASVYTSSERVSDESCRMLVSSNSRESTYDNLARAALQAMRIHCTFGLAWKLTPSQTSCDGQSSWHGPIPLLKAVDAATARETGPPLVSLPLDDDIALHVDAMGDQLRLQFEENICAMETCVMNFECSSITFALLRDSAASIAIGASPFLASTGTGSDTVTDDSPLALPSIKAWWESAPIDLPLRHYLHSNALILNSGLVATIGRFALHVVPHNVKHSVMPQRFSITCQAQSLIVRGHNLPPGLTPQQELHVHVPVLNLETQLWGRRCRAVEVYLPEVRASASDAAIAGVQLLVDGFLSASSVLRVNTASREPLSHADERGWLLPSPAAVVSLE